MSEERKRIDDETQDKERKKERIIQSHLLLTLKYDPIHSNSHTVCCSMTSWIDVRSLSSILSNSSMQQTPMSANTKEPPGNQQNENQDKRNETQYINMTLQRDNEFHPTFQNRLLCERVLDDGCCQSHATRALATSA
jgi:hypothetical protein